MPSPALATSHASILVSSSALSPTASSHLPPSTSLHTRIYSLFRPPAPSPPSHYPRSAVLHTFQNPNRPKLNPPKLSIPNSSLRIAAAAISLLGFHLKFRPTVAASMSSPEGFLSCELTVVKDGGAARTGVCVQRSRCMWVAEMAAVEVGAGVGARSSLFNPCTRLLSFSSSQSRQIVSAKVTSTFEFVSANATSTWREVIPAT
ncbi:mitochondrial division protein 1 [Striga asiatica]|uniref:Mitochondrial division protein 1 n=1 Tax=Striga asiatica TaxID=4170 RepID=A0A5A7P2U8_STRAF|nr:mitochondrial division protein 1 [Striga asiatica]